MQESKSRIVPSLLYRDASAAIQWLCQVFGFTRHAVYEGEGGAIQHAELTMGGGMVMLGSASDEASAEGSGGICLIVDDADAVHAEVLSAGGKITRPLEDKPYGGRAFSCLDPEGKEWHIGTYNPWAIK